MRKRSKIVGSVLGLGVLVVVFLLWSSGPSAADIRVPDRDVKGAVTNDASTKDVAYDKLSLKIPSRLQTKTKNIGTGKPLYVQELFAEPVRDSASLFGDQLAITIGTLPSGGFIDIPDIQLRTRDAAYTVLETNSTLMRYEKSGTTYEIGVFLQNGEYYASFVLTGSRAKEAVLKSELGALVTSVTWR
jgi:hypothetical protein